MFLVKSMKLFKAKDARNELLKAILQEISFKAKNGHSSHTYFESLSDECIKSLEELGYKVEHTEPSYYTIRW